MTSYKGSDQEHSQGKKKCQKSQWLSEQKSQWLSEKCLPVAEKRREVKGKGEKQRYTHLNAEFERIVRRDKKTFISDQCKVIEEYIRIRLQISSRKLEIPREHVMQRWAQ